MVDPRQWGEEASMPKNIYERGGILWACFEVNGGEDRESLRTRSEKVAEKRLKARREEIENQAHYGIAGPMNWVQAFVSWTEAMEADVRAKAISPKTVLRYTVSLNECRQCLDPFEVHQIDAERLRELVKGRKAQHVTNATIRRDLTAISSVLDHAIEEGWVDENAARAYPRKRLQERRDPIELPTQSDIDLTIGRQRTRFGDVMLLARETGMREEEIAGLEHTMLDLANRHATVIGKRNRVRTVTLSAEAVAIIQRHPQA
jgi:integrase/recombinase XerD